MRGSRALFNAVAALLLAVGVVRAAQTGAVLAAREPMFSGLRSAMHAIVAQSPVENPLVVMTYGIRMATLYYELQGKMPQPATYRVRWRAIDDVRDRPMVAGIVVPTDGDQFVRWIEHYRPDLRCRTEEIRQPEGARWPAYAFVCTRAAWKSSRIGTDGPPVLRWIAALPSADRRGQGGFHEGPGFVEAVSFQDPGREASAQP